MIEEIESRLTVAQADYEQKLANAPDMRAAQDLIDVVRSEHAQIRRRKEAELSAFLVEQSKLKRRREDELVIFLVEHAETKRRKEAEFAACQKAAKELKEAESELIRAKKAFRNEHKFSEKEREKAEEMAACEHHSALWDAEWAAAQQNVKAKHDLSNEDMFNVS